MNTKGKVLPSFYKVEEIQLMLGIGRNSAYKLVNRSDFPTVRVGNRIVIPMDLFHEWIDRQAIGGEAVG